MLDLITESLALNHSQAWPNGCVWVGPRLHMLGGEDSQGQSCSKSGRFVRGGTLWICSRCAQLINIQIKMVGVDFAGRDFHLRYADGFRPIDTAAEVSAAWSDEAVHRSSTAQQYHHV